MRVLMFGWEFPPVISGGLGVASEGLVPGLLRAGTEVVLVLPRHPFASPHPGLEIIDAAQVGRRDNPPHRHPFSLGLLRGRTPGSRCCSWVKSKLGRSDPPLSSSSS